MATITTFTYAILSVEMILLILVLIGVYFATQKKFSTHQKIMTTAAIIQILMVPVMIIKFFSGTNYPIIIYFHMTLGTIIALVILYTILVMNKKIPNTLNIKEENQKLLMRITAVLWIIMIFAGSTVFYLIYVASSSV